MAGKRHAAREKVISSAEALHLLREGNAHFVTTHLEHPNLAEERRGAVAHIQHPFAIILGCADSRVAPELIFDRGIGDLFVVRIAGNVFATAVLASLEYGVEYLGIPLIVVLGHERCGAVDAALQALKTGVRFGGHIGTLGRAIRPALESLGDLPSEALLDAAVRANVAHTVQRLKESPPFLRAQVATGELQIIGARFDLDDGIVDFDVA